MEERSSFASNFVWALALVAVVGLIMAGLYYSGFLGKVAGPKQEKIDINVKTPSAIVRVF